MLLLMDIGMSMRNFIHGSPLSVSIGTTPPKGVYSAVSLPRMNLNGRVARITDREEVLARCIELMSGTRC